MKIAQREALINEYKGNLFEYLLGQNLAKHFALEAAFQESLPASLRDRLAFYEDFLLQNDRELYKRLPLLASSVSQSLIPSLNFDVTQICLVGKLSGQNEREEWGEADLILLGKQSQRKISLKLCKENAFVNTKSAGLKSFIEKYFNAFPESFLWQQKLNEKVEKDFYKMAHSLYERVGLEFKGQFDSAWSEAGFSELPGELESSLSELVLSYYSEQAKYLKNCLEFFYNENPRLFCQSLFPLLGLAGEDILQVICFHGVAQGERYQLKDISLMEMYQLNEKFNTFSFGPWDEGKSSFEIRFEKLTLQIRCKPMNKFTVPALKINCSIKKG